MGPGGLVEHCVPALGLAEKQQGQWGTDREVKQWKREM